MMVARRVICSGLTSIGPVCEKRDQCANYTHWTKDMRSVFNACIITGTPHKHYAPRTIAATSAQPINGQGDLFGAVQA